MFLEKAVALRKIVSKYWCLTWMNPKPSRKFNVDSGQFLTRITVDTALRLQIVLRERADPKAG